MQLKFQMLYPITQRYKTSLIFENSNLMSGWRTFWLMPKIYDVEKTHLAKGRKRTFHA